MSEYISENTSESMSPSLSVLPRTSPRVAMHAALRLAVLGLLALGARPIALPAQQLTGEQMREGDVRQRRQWWVSQRAGADGRVPHDKVAAMREMRTSARAGAFSSSLAGERWQPMGPMGFISMNTRYASAPMQDEGRFSTIAINPRNPRVMLAGAGSAGIWRTVNGGASWQALGDTECSTAIGHIVIDPVNPDIVYAGTGETFDPVGYTDGCGILKSTNGGDSWTRVAASILAPADRKSVV